MFTISRFVTSRFKCTYPKNCALVRVIYLLCTGRGTIHKLVCDYFGEGIDNVHYRLIMEFGKLMIWPLLS